MIRTSPERDAANGPAGLIMVLTGDGKGKTTSAFGQALRASGAGMRVGIVQFIKGPWKTGEVKALQSTELPVEVVRSGLGFTIDGLRDKRIDMDDHRAVAQDGLRQARSVLASGDYGLVVLDEVLGAISGGLIDESDVLEAVAGRAHGTTVVLTGRGASDVVQDAADLVSEVRLVKHHYQDGVEARRGIEF